jgi:hypothetical protein
MRLRSAKDDMAANVGEGPLYVDPAAGQVDIADTQGRVLSLSAALA